MACTGYGYGVVGTYWWVPGTGTGWWVTPGYLGLSEAPSGPSYPPGEASSLGEARNPSGVQLDPLGSRRSPWDLESSLAKPGTVLLSVSRRPG